MPDPKRRFEVIEGGSGRAEKPLVDTGTAGKDKPAFKPPKPSSGGGRGGGTQAVRLATLEHSVDRAWKALGLLAVAFGAAFLFFLVRIDDRFDRVDEPLRTLSTNVAVQTETLNSVNDKISDLRTHLDRANDQHQTTVGEIRHSTEGNVTGRRP